MICSVRNKKQSYADRSAKEIADDLKKGRQEGFEWVEFTGGEPTIRKDIVQLVAEAKKLGYQKIAFSTNGRLFSYPKFCQAIISAGLNKITFSLLGYDKKIHEAVSRTPGSFDEIVKGIKNSQLYPSVHLNISSVISRLNYKNLKKFGQFVHSLGIEYWYLLDLIPDSNAKKFYKNLVVRLKDLEPELNSLIEVAGDFKELGFFDFPLCLFKPALRKKSNVCFVNAKGRAQSFKQVGYNPERFGFSKDGSYFDSYRQDAVFPEGDSYHDVYRQNIDVCRRCQYDNECGGVWREYLDKFNGKEIMALAKNNKCLKKLP